MNIGRKILFCLLLILVFPMALYAWTGKVVGISDGDTITVLHNGKGVKIRLYGIDTPEKRQAFGKKAKQFTSDMVFGNTVNVAPKDVDRYGRIVGLVYIDDSSLNQALVKNGYAWVYRKYCKETFCKDWLNLESTAKGEKIGLWAEPTPIPPWKYRHNKKSESSNKREPAIKKPSRTKSGVYHGNIKSKIFHTSECKYYNCKNCTSDFQNREEAIKAGYRGCKACKP